MVGYPKHVVLLSYPRSFVDHCILHGLTCVGFLPVSIEIRDGDDPVPPQFSSRTKEKETKKILLHQAIRKFLKPLENFVFEGFEVYLKIEGNVSL